jgi:hypothetical protein
MKEAVELCSQHSIIISLRRNCTQEDNTQTIVFTESLISLYSSFSVGMREREREREREKVFR